MDITAVITAGTAAAGTIVMDTMAIMDIAHTTIGDIGRIPIGHITILDHITHIITIPIT